MTKTCSKCNTEKPISEYHNNGGRLRSNCKCCANTKSKERYQSNKRKILAKQKEYYEKNKEKIIKKNKDYYEENKADVLARNKKWRCENIDAKRAYDREYVKRNKKARATYLKDNKERFNEYNRIYRLNKRKATPAYRLKHNLRGRLYKALNGILKNESTEELLGCTFDCARQHLENQFTKGMSWDNYGLYGWHVDHIVPLASFDLSDPAQQKEANHYTNLQPLWAEDNLRKSDKLSHEYIYENNNKKGNK